EKTSGLPQASTRGRCWMYSGSRARRRSSYGTMPRRPTRNECSFAARASHALAMLRMSPIVRFMTERCMAVRRHGMTTATTRATKSSAAMIQYFMGLFSQRRAAPSTSCRWDVPLRGEVSERLQKRHQLCAVLRAELQEAAARCQPLPAVRQDRRLEVRRAAVVQKNARKRIGERRLRNEHEPQPPQRLCADLTTICVALLDPVAE